MRTEVEECIEDLRFISNNSCGPPCNAPIVRILDQAAKLLEAQQKEIKKLRKDLEEREILGLQILYKEIGAERDQFLKGLQDIKKHIETMLPNTKRMSIAWNIANKALTEPIKSKND